MALTDKLPLNIPKRLVTPVLVAALDFLAVLGERFTPDVDEDDNRILFYHTELHRGVQLRWHDGEVVAFMGEREPEAETARAPYNPDPGFDDAIARLRAHCISEGIKIEADYDYPFDGPLKGTLTGIGKHPEGRMN